MAYETTTCPLCKRQGHRTEVSGAHNCYQYSGCGCPVYYIWRHDKLTFLDNPQELEKQYPHRIRALLRERDLKRLPRAVLEFSSGPYEGIAGSVPVRVQDLLATWPDSIPERIDRSFVNLVNSISGWSIPGQEIELRDEYISDFRFFTDSKQTVSYFMEAMRDYGWIENRKIRGHLCVTPKGWARYEELTRSKGSVRNPAFVAMWFGGEDRAEEMKRLFERAIRPAIKSAGYLAKRADTDEHNDPIMDRIIYDIRIAPFVVAEFTKENRGVYYEAGLAHGLGIEVIHCYPAEAKPHFDVSGLKQVRWRDPEDLRTKIENRILGTVGRGPHTFDDENRRGAKSSE